MAARGAPSGGAHRFEVDDDAEDTVVLNRGRKKAKGLGSVTWLALITFGIIAVSLMDAHHRAVRPSHPRATAALRAVSCSCMRHWG
jgi:hypothetical protein